MSVHTDAVLRPSAESLNKRQNVAKSTPYPIDPQLLENPFWNSLQDAGRKQSTVKAAQNVSQQAVQV